MILTLITIGNMLNYILELAIILYTLKYILLIPLTKSSIKKYSAITLSVIWLLYTLLSDSPWPQTFIILPISLLIFCEHKKSISFTVISETLAINTITLIVFYSYCLIIGTDYNRLLHMYIDSISLIIIFASIIKFKTILLINIEFLNKIPAKKFILFFCFILVNFFLSSVSSLLFSKNIKQRERNILLLAIYTVIIASIIIFILYLRIVRIRSELEQLNKMKSKMLSLEEKHYKDMLEKNIDLRAFRHDYNYHITAMQALAQNNDFYALKDYVNHLTQIKAKVYFISTNNTISDAIINYFYENLPEDTDFKIDGKFLENTFISNDDMCVILSNLLKNAYEAICKINTTNKTIYNNTHSKPNKHIYISIYDSKDNIIIYIENTYQISQNHDRTNYSTYKSDTINHGFGLKNVKNTIKKYDGKLEIKSDKNIFSVYVFLHNTI